MTIAMHDCNFVRGERFAQTPKVSATPDGDGDMHRNDVRHCRVWDTLNRLFAHYTTRITGSRDRQRRDGTAVGSRRENRGSETHSK
ncbi:hypothetical protein GCM10025859_27270 [Alicyclobacillus fastidiosus]|nr:hypothetical protein GCM10025859_27270 [Alicyclobacillus fastidiosus]